MVAALVANIAYYPGFIYSDVVATRRGNCLLYTSDAADDLIGVVIGCPLDM